MGKESNYWKITALPFKERRSFSALAIEKDVVIVGAGIAGLSTAFWLNQYDLNVIVLEKEKVGAGATGASGGMLTLSPPTDYFLLIEKVGIKKAQEFYNLVQYSLSLIKELIKSFDFDCWFEQTGSIQIATHSSHIKIIEKEYQALKKLGILCEFLEKKDLEKIIKISPVFAGVKIPEDCAFHPLRFCQEIANLLEQKNVEIFENSEVKNISEERNRVLVHTKHGSVISKACFIMTDGYFPFLGFQDRKSKGSKIIYAIVTAPLSFEMKVAVGWRRKELIWDVKEDFDYFRLLPDNRIFFGTNFEKKRIFSLPEDFPSEAELLKNRFNQRFPQLKELTIQYYWGGLIGLRNDFFPFIGKLGNKVWGAGCYNGEGLVLGFLAGKLLADAFVKKKKIPLIFRPE